MVAAEDREALIQAKLDTWYTASLVEAVGGIDGFLAELPKALAGQRDSDLNGCD